MGFPSICGRGGGAGVVATACTQSDACWIAIAGIAGLGILLQDERLVLYRDGEEQESLTQARASMGRVLVRAGARASVLALTTLMAGGVAVATTAVASARRLVSNC